MIGIYKITNPKGKVYIGQSVDIYDRWRQYRTRESKSQVKLNRSFLKYGVENHIFEVIVECEVSELNELERYYQDIYNVLSEGLNCRLTTSKDRSGYISEESRIKMSISAKKKVMTEEHKKKLFGGRDRPNPMLGKNHTEETKMIISMKNKGKKHFGMKHSEETKLKIVQKALGRKASEETKIKMSKTRKGVKQSQELIQKRAFSNSHIFLNPENGIFYIGTAEASFSVNLAPSTFKERRLKGKTNLILV